jgi:DNA-binding NtrC family response regulator
MFPLDGFGRALIGRLPMSQGFEFHSDFSEPALPVASLAPSLSLHQIVPLLIGSTVGEIERELVLQTLARCDGNRTRAARVLGVSVRTLRNKIRLYAADGIDVPAHGE